MNKISSKQAENAPAAARKTKHFEAKDMWTCPHCFQAFTAEQEVALRKRRHRHLRSRHPEVKSGDRSVHLREYVPLAVATEKLPESERAWTCAFCDCGLPSLSRTAHEKAFLTTIVLVIKASKTLLPLLVMHRGQKQTSSAILRIFPERMGKTRWLSNCGPARPRRGTWQREAMFLLNSRYRLTLGLFTNLRTLRNQCLNALF